MKKYSRKLNKKRVIGAIAVLIAVIITGSFLVPDLPAIIAILIMAAMVIYGVIYILKEIKTVILIIAMILAFTFLGTNVISSVFLGFFFNTVYISLFFEPEWSRKKHKINKEISKKKYHNLLVFNGDLFDLVKNRGKAIMTMLFYSISVLPAVTLAILKENKESIKKLLPWSEKIYNFVTSAFRLPKIPEKIAKQISLSIFLVLFFMIINLIIIIFSKQSSQTYKDIANKYERPENTWTNSKKPALNDNELIYVDVINEPINSDKANEPINGDVTNEPV